MQDDFDLLEKVCQARVGTNLGVKWRLDRLLGIGGMAAVYEASHRNGARAAIKILHAEVAGNVEALRRFLREAYIANKAGRGAVAVLDDDVDAEGTPYLVMELLVGETVYARVEEKGGRLPIADVVWIARETLTTLEQAHKNGIIHRDLKPENLFLTEDGRLKILDFGIARMHDPAPGAERTRAGFVMGTPGYMAPEQALGQHENVDARTDIWAVGAIMYKLLSGHIVHEGAANELVTAGYEPAAPLRRTWPSAPRQIARIVDRALAYAQNARYPDASSMLADVGELDNAERARGEALPPSPPPPPAGTGSKAPAEFGAEEPSSTGFATQMSESDAAALRHLFTSIEVALRLMGEHGARHPESVKAFEVAFAEAGSVLEVAHIGLFWNVRPEGFAARTQEIVWAPRPPLANVPKHLYQAGVRMLGILPGLTQKELAGLLGVLVSAYAGGGRSLQRLEESSWEHIVHRVEPKEGANTGAQLVKPEDKGKPDVESPPKAEGRRRGAQSVMEEAAVITFAAGLDDALTAAFDRTRPGARQRFVETTFAAIRIARARNQAPLVTGPLGAALEARAATDPGAVTAFVVGLCDALAAQPESAPGAVEELARAIVSAVTIKALIASFAAEAKAGGRLDRDALEACISKAGRGHEEVIGQAIAGVDVDLGTRLVGVLSGLGTEAGSRVIHELAERAPPLLRVAALAAAEAPQERVRLALGRLFENRDPGLRIALLGVISRVRLKTAVPQLALRARAQGFDELPIDERRQTLSTLAVLVPSRAETLGVELLLDQRLIPSDAHERTREMAAEMLGSIASSREAVDALTAVSRNRWRNSERVRAAAGRALQAIADRPPRSSPSGSSRPDRKSRPSRISQLAMRAVVPLAKGASKAPPPAKQDPVSPPNRREGRVPSKRPPSK